jgi:hypothetical protein
MNPIIFTHCGKLGDFAYTLPIASAYYKRTGRKVHFVLPLGFPPFHKLRSLLELQDFFSGLSLVPHRVRSYGCGGLPYHFNPAKWGITGEYYNLGFRWWPDKYATAFQAEEYGLDYDPNWVLNIGPLPDIIEDTVSTEQEVMSTCVHSRIDVEQPLLYNLQRIAAAKHRNCFFSGFAAFLYLARIPFTLYREPWQPETRYYFPDSTRYNLVQISDGYNPDSGFFRRNYARYLVLKEKFLHERIQHSQSRSRTP